MLNIKLKHERWKKNWQKQEQELDHGIGKDTEVFLTKKLEDNEVTLLNVPKGVAFEKINSRQSVYRALYPGIKFQSAIYPSWRNAYD